LESLLNDISFIGPIKPEGFKGIFLLRTVSIGEVVERLLTLPNWIRSPMKRLRQTLATVISSLFTVFNISETDRQVFGCQGYASNFPFRTTSAVALRLPGFRTIESFVITKFSGILKLIEYLALPAKQFLLTEKTANGRFVV